MAGPAQKPAPRAAKQTAQKAAVRRLSRDDVIDAGVEITAANGLSGLTLQAVSEHLGIRRPSLYHHLPGGHDELISAVANAIRERMGAESEPQMEDVRTLADVEQWLSGAGSVSERYPGVLEYFLTDGRNEATTLEEADRVATALLDSELADAAPEAFAIMHAFLTGWALTKLPDRDAALRHGYPELAELLGAADKLDTQQVLFDGLRALLTGLAPPASPLRTP